MRRRAFTLLEVMVAIVLTSIVVLVAYAMAQAGLDARARFAARLSDVQSTRAARQILRDALRNARAPQHMGDPAGGFSLANGTLSFVAAGGATPLDPDYDWRFTIAPAGTGLAVSAVALGHTTPAQVAFTIPGVTRWDVWLLSADGQDWLTDWNDPKEMPRAIVVAFWNGTRLVDVPLHLALWPGSSLAHPDSLPHPGATPSTGARLVAQ
jgi:prepilin-type N-terminal cleavage/methylation domain-containing protein